MVHTNTRSITTLILCGGLGTRLRSVIGNTPKILAPIAGRPFVYFIIHYLLSQGLSNVILCTGYKAEQVAAACKGGTQWGLNISYSLERKPLGTGGALKNAQHLIASDPFVVINGDSLLQADINRLIIFHVREKAKITMALTEVVDQRRFGSVRLGHDGSIVKFNEKGEEGKGLINGGIYIMDRLVLENLAPEGYVSLEYDVFPRFVGNGLYGMVVPGPFIDIGTPAVYEMAHTLLLGN